MPGNAASVNGFLRVALATVTVLPLGACSTVGYYAQLAHGEASVLAARQPIARVIDDPGVDAQLKARLQLAEQARAFASEHLKLPRNRSYSQYADLHRPYVMWDVFAAPEFSLTAFEQCYVIVGCVAYRGYYTHADAQAYARRLCARGFETWVEGVVAYSTLGYFADPILNTMMSWSDDELAGTIFHELAHQLVYVKGDTEFNESFAAFVQREGLKQWRASRGLPQTDDDEQRREEEFDRLVQAARGRLAELYASGLPADVMRTRKREEIQRLRAEYVRIRDTHWRGDHTYDDWFTGEINNAKLAAFGLYHRWLPAFAALYTKSGGDWDSFYAAVDRIAHASGSNRAKQLHDLESNPSTMLGSSDRSSGVANARD